MTHARSAVNAIFFVNGFLHANLASRYPRMQDFFGLSNGTLGMILLSSSIGAVLAMPFTGWLIIRNGSRRIGIISVFSYCICFPLVTLVPGIPGLVALFFMMGVTAGMLDVSMNAQAVMVERGLGKPIMTSFHALFSIGMAIGAVCGSLFEKFSIGFQLHLTVITAAGIAAALWVRYHLIHDKPEASAEAPAFQLPNAAMVSIGVIAFCCMLGEGAMADWSTNYMERVVLSPKALAPIGLSAFALAMTTGRILGDSGRARYGDRKLMVSCSILSTAGIVLSLLVTSPYLVIAGFFLVGLGLSVIVPIAYSIAGNNSELGPGVGLAMVTTVGYTGFLFGPPIIGFIADLAGLRIGLIFVAVLFIAMTLLSYRYRTPGK
ncbi:MAG: MFS transporter [Bacteroidota bacterium]